MVRTFGSIEIAERIRRYQLNDLKIERDALLNRIQEYEDNSSFSQYWAEYNSLNKKIAKLAGEDIITTAGNDPRNIW